MTLWSNVLFNLVVLINSIIAFFYPFEKNVPGKSKGFLFPISTSAISTWFRPFSELNSHLSWLIWAVTLISLASVFTLPRPSGIRTFVASIILRMIFSIGPAPTLWLLGFITVILKGVHIVSLMGNHGTLEKHLLKIVTDVQLIYNCGYMIFCLAGMLVHPFFYSVLVSFSSRSNRRFFCN